MFEDDAKVPILAEGTEVEVAEHMDVDILDIGRQIVDAPLLDMRLEVVDS